MTTTVRKYYTHPPPNSNINFENENENENENNNISFQHSSQLIRLPFSSNIIRSGYVYDFEMTRHCPFDEDDHPEQPARITRIHESLKNENCLSKMFKLSSRKVTKAEVTLVHSPEHWDRINMLACRCKYHLMFIDN